MDLEKYTSNVKTSYLVQSLQELLKQEEELVALSADESMKEMALADLANISSQKDALIAQMDEILAVEEKEEEFPNEIVLEIRAGVGGEEAALFAEKLAIMYTRYAERRSWAVSTLDKSESSLGGYKDVSYEMRGKGVYEALRFETGVHRIQRIPATEKSGRVHTSTASVAILPIRKKVSFQLDMKDVEIETSRSGGKGGQNVNKVETAVRVIHIPTGLDVRSTNQRSQLTNKEKALEILTAKIQLLKEQEDHKKFSDNRNDQIGSGDRSEKIRTYNILQDRITDHRIKESWHNIETIFAGDLDDIIEALASNTGEKGEYSDEADE
jgi:peptide chain release factor 1